MTILTHPSTLNLILIHHHFLRDMNLGSQPEFVSSASISGPTKRVKDGQWDSGEGKWEMSRQSNTYNPSTSGTGPTSETDAIQTWKAEMKAMDAKKKQAAAAAAAAAANPTQSTLANSSASAVISSPNAITQYLASTSHTSDSLSAQVGETSKDNIPVSIRDDSQPTSSPTKSPHFASLLPPSSLNAGSNVSGPNDDTTVLPRASRFAKFFDSSSAPQKEEYDRASVFGKPPPSAPSYLDTSSPVAISRSPLDHQSNQSFNASGHLSEDSGKSLQRSASADPENMARVLSMLQMSSQVRPIHALIFLHVIWLIRLMGTHCLIIFYLANARFHCPICAYLVV